MPLKADIRQLRGRCRLCARSRNGECCLVLGRSRRKQREHVTGFSPRFGAKPQHLYMALALVVFITTKQCRLFLAAPVAFAQTNNPAPSAPSARNAHLFMYFLL